MAYVGTLQDLGRPYSMLFVDKKHRQLYMFVRVSDGDENGFIVVPVSSQEIESYMDGSLGLLDILNNCSYRKATINNDKIYLGNQILHNFCATNRMARMNKFDPELCEDDVWIEVFLNRINNNQPIEIA